jgi:hypothetical protein
VIGFALLGPIDGDESPKGNAPGESEARQAHHY